MNMSEGQNRIQMSINLSYDAMCQPPPSRQDCNETGHPCCCVAGMCNAVSGCSTWPQLDNHRQEQKVGSDTDDGSDET